MAKTLSYFSSGSKLFSTFRSSSFHQQQPPQWEKAPHLLPNRGYHIDLGAREKALLEEDPALKRFKSYKNTAKRVSKVGNALTVLVIAAFNNICLAAMRFQASLWWPQFRILKKAAA